MQDLKSQGAASVPAFINLAVDQKVSQPIFDKDNEIAMTDKISDDDDTYSQSSLDSIEDQQESEEAGSKSQCSSDKKCCSDMSDKCVNLLQSENKSASIYEGGNNTDKSDSGSSDYEHKAQAEGK